MDAQTVKLNSAVVGPTGKDVAEVTVKPITAKMYFRHGDLMRSEVRTNGNTDTIFVEPNMDALRGYMADCIGWPAPLLDNLHLKDLAQIKRVIEGFFQDFQ